MDLVTDTQLHAGEPHCCISVASQSPLHSFRVLKLSVSIQINLEQFIFCHCVTPNAVSANVVEGHQQ